jgi:Na+/phosphate symporter
MQSEQSSGADVGSTVVRTTVSFSEKWISLLLFTVWQTDGCMLNTTTRKIRIDLGTSNTEKLIF